MLSLFMSFPGLLVPFPSLLGTGFASVYRSFGWVRTPFHSLVDEFPHLPWLFFLYTPFSKLNLIAGAHVSTSVVCGDV